jgi:hypothetical protein
MVYESGNVDFSGNVFKVKPSSVEMNVTGNWYFHGYWIFNSYMREIEDVIRKELSFPAIIDEKNQMYAACIQQTNSVAIHVRRGDMVQLGRAMAPEFFKGAIKEMETKILNAYYFLFSDDLPWCLEHYEELGLDVVKERVILVEDNCGENAYRDLQLMSYCKHQIISFSSFSVLAAFLNNNAERIVIKGW